MLELRCQWLATFTGPSPDLRRHYLFRAVLQDRLFFILRLGLRTVW